MILISILIPCFNEETHIEACLQSVLNFEIPDNVDIEVIVLDGASKDRTRELVDSFTTRDPRIRCINNPNRTQSSGLNIGIRQCLGEWVMRLDAHTTYPANYLRLCYEIASETGADNTGGICVTKPGSKQYGAKLIQAITTHKFGVGNSGFRVGTQSGPKDTVPFGFFRKSIFDKIGLFDERLVRTQDFEFNQRIKASGGIVYSSTEIISTYFNLARFSQFLKKQISKQGPYNAYMWYLAPYSFTYRHVVTVCFAFLFYTGLCLSFASRTSLLFFFIFIIIYFLVGIFASIQQALRYNVWQHLFFLPIGFFLFHLSHGTGVLTGLILIALKASPVQKVKEPWLGFGKFRAWPQ